MTRTEAPPIVRQIVNRCHVGDSDRQVIRYFISRLKHGYATWRTLTRAERKQWLGWIVATHAENRGLYGFRQENEMNENTSTIETKAPAAEPLTPVELRLAKLACTLATDELRRRKTPHTTLIGELDALYERLRGLGA